MISFVLATALYASAAQAGPPPQLRKNFSSCLSRFSKANADAKLDPAAFKTGAKAACTAEEAAFRKAAVDYDVKMRISRREAEEGADLQIEDYFANMADSYQVQYGERADPK